MQILDVGLVQVDLGNGVGDLGERQHAGDLAARQEALDLLEFLQFNY